MSLVIAGFVKTPLNDSIAAAKPLEVSDAGRRRSSNTDSPAAKRRSLFPLALYIVARLARVLPARLVDRLFAQFDVNVPETKERMHS